MKENNRNMAFDCHVHIGQFEKTYFYPYKVIDILAKNGVAGAYFSSTTSCMEWDNLAEKRAIISHISDEIQEALNYARKIGFDARPLCWVIPKRVLEGESLEQIYSECEYCGFKIHPRAHNWDLTDQRIVSLFDGVCAIAARHNVPIWIHTGVCDMEMPDKFEKWFQLYPKVTFVLAHCKDIGYSIKVLNKYANVLGDVSFNTVDAYHILSKNGLGGRMIFGSDFPIMLINSTSPFEKDEKIYQLYANILEYWKRPLKKTLINNFQKTSCFMVLRNQDTKKVCKKLHIPLQRSTDSATNGMTIPD